MKTVALCFNGFFFIKNRLWPYIIAESIKSIGGFHNHKELQFDFSYFKHVDITMKSKFIDS